MDEFHGRGKIFNDSPEPLLEDFDFKYFADIDKYWQFYEGTFLYIKEISPMTPKKDTES